jgi:hypothetical protein
MHETVKVLFRHRLGNANVPSAKFPDEFLPGIPNLPYIALVF